MRNKETQPLIILQCAMLCFVFASCGGRETPADGSNPIWFVREMLIRNRSSIQGQRTMPGSPPMRFSRKIS